MLLNLMKEILNCACNCKPMFDVGQVLVQNEKVIYEDNQNDTAPVM
jgi:hypothetical protein